MTSVVFIIALVLLGSLAFAAASLAPWVLTWKKDVPRIMALANLKSGEIFYDLGYGDGRVIVYAAKHFGVEAIGVELALPMILVCWIRKFIARRCRIGIWYPIP